MDVLGLPLHPLVVHAAVVLVPLAAVGALLVVAFPNLRARYGWLTAGFAAAAAVAAITARFSGEVLASDLGLLASARLRAHRAWGLWAPWPALVLALSLPALLRSGTPGRAGRVPARRVSAAVTVVAAVAALVLIALTGHAGATAVWGR